MKAALISDTHGMLPDPDKVKDVDFVIHAGDIGPDFFPARPKKEIIRWYEGEFFRWCLDIGKPIYMTYGNHDFVGERIPQRIKESLAPNVHIYVDEQVEIEGKKVWFSPWSNLFGDWAWMLDEDALRRKYFNNIPDDTQVIVSHGPPYGLGDKIFWDGVSQNVGSRSLLSFMDRLADLEMVVCGHIHEARGYYADGEVDVWNVSLVNEKYEQVHEPVVIDWN